jgi:hypothetical protein
MSFNRMKYLLKSYFGKLIMTLMHCHPELVEGCSANYLVFHFTIQYYGNTIKIKNHNTNLSAMF